MLQIPGVIDMYEFSEAKEIVDDLVELYKKLFEVPCLVRVINKNIAMCNFVTQMHIPPNTYLDLATVAYDAKGDKGECFR